MKSELVNCDVYVSKLNGFQNISVEEKIIYIKQLYKVLN